LNVQKNRNSQFTEGHLPLRKLTQNIITSY